MTTSIPVTTLSNLRQNLVPPSLLDLLYIQQGSEHDRDAAISIGQLLGTQVIQSFLNDRDNWRTFTIDENNRITLGDYQRNVIIVPSAKDQRVTLDHFPSNGIIIYAPDWDSASESTAVTVGDNYGARPIIKGGVGIFYKIGSSQTIVARSLISSGDYSLAVLKELITDKLKIKSDLTLPALSILSEYIATGAVTTDKIATGAVTTGKISTHAVETDKIADGAITREKIFYGEVTTDKLANYAVETDKIATGAVTSYKISTHAVETDKIADEAVTSEKLAKQLSFVKTPKFPKKLYQTIVVTQNSDFDIVPNYDGTRFSTDGTHTIIQRMHFTDADNRFQIGDTYRIYNDTPNVITVKDWSTDDTVTKIPAWAFKDFYYYGVFGWELA